MEHYLKLYDEYLQTPRLDWQKEMRRPVKPNIRKAMISSHKKYGEDPNPIMIEAEKNGGKVFFWSDLHLFHYNIIKYANRPFDGLGHMHKNMIDNYYRTVSEKDVVIFGGDIGFGDVDQIKNIIKELPGKKILVFGNHDFEKNNYTYRNYGCFDAVCMVFMFERHINNRLFKFIVSHYPIHEDVLEADMFNIHGHIHQYDFGVKNINMCVEKTGFQPLEFSKLVLNYC